MGQLYEQMPHCTHLIESGTSQPEASASWRLYPDFERFCEFIVCKFKQM
jgi:hypothetical protein